jgi:alanyl-tRNA synthetase
LAQWVLSILSWSKVRTGHSPFLLAEEESFLSTLKSGTTIFDLAVEEVKISKAPELAGDTIFKLHDTYGFPFDLTLEMAS